MSPARKSPSPADDAREPLVEGCRAGQNQALEELFRTHAPMIQRVLGRLVGPVADLEDLVQTVFLEAFASISRFRGEASLKTWLTRIAVHVGHHYLRAGKIRRHVSLDLVPEEAIRQEPNHDRALEEHRLAPELHRLLDRLDPKKRIALLLYVVEGYAVEEIAALTGASRTAVRSRIFFGRRELRKLLDADPRLSAHIEAVLSSREAG
jgi:RNA polymerase sigma-70 factor (ECF subfamily)